MEFRRARTKEQIKNRQSEILNACTALYKENNYDDITLKAISDMTSLSRTTMYSYYKTKDEIFLDLIKREYFDWNQELKKGLGISTSISREDFCHLLTDSLLKRDLMLRLISVQMTVIEKNCSIEQLSTFKKDVQVIFDTLSFGIDKVFPSADDEKKQYFLMQLLIFILGIYPCTHPTKKQTDAMILAGIEIPHVDEQRLCYEGIFNLTENLL